MKPSQILLKITNDEGYKYPEMDLHTFIKIISNKATSSIDLSLTLEFRADELDITISILDKVIKLNDKHVVDLGKRLSMISKLKGQIKTLKADGKCSH